ncbi:hypothetical protein V6N13_118512 [Hibiscus sabdariffa]|uniref:RING-type E3 ubiquitin transferase n=2 Tax=Hibiscus sabdariffa TaxID=183260 RepID=A0ABR2NW43_9ROSI
MRHGEHYTPPPLLSPSAQPALNTATAASNQHPMLISIFLALFLPCAGMSVVFIVYICLLWYASNYRAGNSGSSSVKQVGEKGLSASELEKLPKVTGKELVLGTECAVCLDEIGADQSARMVPGCRHSFHLQCADTWLSKHSVCPLCRAKLEPNLFASSDDNPC